MKVGLGWAANRILFGALLAICGLLALWLPHLSRPASAGPGVIVVDPGHGGVDGGAESPSGVMEAGLNLTVSKLLRRELEALGYRVTLTREDESALAAGKNADLAARRDIMNRDNVMAVVSIHMNKFSDCAVHGPMAFYMEGSDEGARLAKLTIDSVTDAIGAPRRHANPGDYYVIRESRPPAVLVECGFLSNSSDEALLQQPEYQRKLARGIARGVHAYLSDTGGS